MPEWKPAEPTAKIGDKTYTLNSDNKDLLQMLKEVKWNKETGKMEDVPYMPIETVYQLLEQFFPNYSFVSHPLELEKTFVIKKNKYNKITKKKEESEEEVMLFKKSVTLKLGNREIDGSSRSVATVSQITVDQMYNGFDMKSESRAIKNAAKKLGRVFRISNDMEELIEKDSITEDLAVTDIVNTTAKKPVVNDTSEIINKLKENIRKEYEERIGDKTPTSEDLKAYGKEIREKGGLNWDGEKALKEVYKDLKTFYNIK